MSEKEAPEEKDKDTLSELQKLVVEAAERENFLNEPELSKDVTQTANLTSQSKNNPFNIQSSARDKLPMVTPV